MRASAENRTRFVRKKWCKSAQKFRQNSKSRRKKRLPSHAAVRPRRPRSIDTTMGSVNNARSTTFRFAALLARVCLPAGARARPGNVPCPCPSYSMRGFNTHVAVCRVRLCIGRMRCRRRPAHHEHQHPDRHRCAKLVRISRSSQRIFFCFSIGFYHGPHWIVALLS
jgi:hypothetical protein